MLRRGPGNFAAARQQTIESETLFLQTGLDQLRLIPSFPSLLLAVLDLGDRTLVLPTFQHERPQNSFDIHQLHLFSTEQ